MYFYELQGLKGTMIMKSPNNEKCWLLVRSTGNTGSSQFITSPLKEHERWLWQNPVNQFQYPSDLRRWKCDKILKEAYDSTSSFSRAQWLFALFIFWHLQGDFQACWTYLNVKSALWHQEGRRTSKCWCEMEAEIEHLNHSDCEMSFTWLCVCV